jgi:hypothetical protein
MPADPRELLDSLSAPLGDLISSVGSSVAAAQAAMDAATIRALQHLYADGSGELSALRAIGYQPTWYQIPEVTAEINIALSISGSTTESRGPGPTGKKALQLYGAPVDASYANRYSYDLKAASTLRFRIVPVPPSPAAEQLRAVPGLVGLSWSDAQRILEAAAVPYRTPSGTPTPAMVVRAQSREPGALLSPGDLLELTLGT